MPKKKNTGTKIVEPVLHIYCEGEKTEPIYINGYINHYHSEHRNILVVEDTNKNTPVQLVEIAIKAKESNPDNDIFWVVFDRESVVKYPHDLHLNAKQKAESNGIEIAISNVCFEYWLLLHLKCTTAGYQNYDDLIKNSELKKLLKNEGLKQDYDKADTQIFDLLKNNISTAIINAEKVKNNAISTAEAGKESPCYYNAYIDFHELLIDMKIFIEKKQYSELLNSREDAKNPDERKINIEDNNKSIRKLNPSERKKKIQNMIKTMSNEF
ncbi:RloB family protein [Aliarcobacter butzleri]|uniref:RloB family protein n=1 Tax=Aliarcobacter butzleri TaxID=28197 RepID=UPI003AFB6F60